MNFVLKQHAPNGIMETFVNNVKRLDRSRYICGHCLKRHTIVPTDAREMSNYVSALRLMLRRKQKLENCTPVKLRITNKNRKGFEEIQNKRETINKFTELVRVSKHNSRQTRMTIRNIQACDVSAFAEEPGMTFTYEYKNTYGSTRTYDPNLLLPGQSTGSENLLNYKKDISTNSTSKCDIKKSPLTNIKKADISKNLLGIKENSKPYASIRTKPTMGSTDSVRKSGNYLKQNNIKANVLRMLPLSAVKIMPLPKNVHDISKVSPSTIKNLIKPDDSEDLLNPQVKHVDNLEALITSNVGKQEVQGDDWFSFYDKQHIKQMQENVSPKEFSFMRFLHSYIDVSINNNMLIDALRILLVCRQKQTWKNSTGKYLMVDVYNTTLHGFSAKGDWNTVSLIREWMKLDQVKLNYQSYAALLDCLARVDKSIFHSNDLWKKEIIKVIKELYTSQYTLNDLFTKTTLPKDKREKVLSTVREVLPYFEVEPSSVELNSSCPLLQNLHKGYSQLSSQLEQDPNKDLEFYMEKSVEEQLLIEKKFNVKVRAISNRHNDDVSSAQKQKFEKMNHDWREMIRDGLLRKLKMVELEHSRSSKFNLYVFLKCLPVDNYVDLMMETVQSLLEYSGGYSPATSLLYTLLGEKVYRRYEIKRKIDMGVFERTDKLFKKYCSWYVDPVGPARNTRQEWQMLMQDFLEGHHLSTREVRWPEDVKKAVGKCLYDIIIKNVKINLGVNKEDGRPRMVPAFYLIFRFQKIKRTEEIKCHPSLSNLFRKVGYDYLNFDANQIPMVCPPKPWMNIHQGGYLILPADFVRRPEMSYDKVIDYKQVPGRQLYATFDSLNGLQAVPWIVNEGVLDIVMDVFQNGGSEEMNIPKLPSTEPVHMNITAGMSSEEKLEEYKRKSRILSQRQNEYGLWCETLYRLSLADHFRKKVFWLPQNFDFRGRVYPIPPHLNHLGADLFRSLLLFAKAKPLGPNGLDWLKIHVINLTGTHKKRPVEERLEYANHILGEILDSAERPLTGNKWWVKSDEPWQTLATCMEIKKVLDSPNPELYMSQFPVHQDGSCNGLQHYAALGRDIIGARSVNLAPDSSPQDVYMDVTQIIESKRLEDAENGNEIAKVLEGFVKRKVVKQTIMTTVYGVTPYGARLQIAGQLRDIPEFPDEYVWRGAIYLAQKTFESLQQMFTSAKEIQEWLIKCAKIICLKREHVQWISPIGLPIMQPYSKFITRRQKDTQNVTQILVPNQLKQKNAFPPNFVHSLDSCHMMLTALFCEQAGLTFASIHDCFWTHPSTVEVMNRICRERFIALHSQDILEDLSKFFINLYVSNNSEIDEEALKIFKSVPKTGDFNLKSVLDSVYFFS